MTPPKEEQEWNQPVTGSRSPVQGKAGTRKDPQMESGPGWQMPWGEDLLNFALSAGLAAGSWWLEMQRRPETGPADPENAEPLARREAK